MKVFHLMSGAPYGGVERQAMRLASVPAREKIEQRVMFSVDATRAKRFEAMGLTTVEMEFSSRFTFFDRRRISSTIRRFAPDIVISWTPDVVALVQTENLVYLGRLGTDFNHQELLNKRQYIFTPVQSRADAAMVAGWSVQHAHVLPHLPMVEDELKVKPLSRKLVYTPPTAKPIFTSMRLAEKMGLVTLLDAVARLSGFYLWIAGDGADRVALEAAALERGVKPRVRFLGWQDNLVPYLSTCDVFVYPAKQDDVGDAVIEAWAGRAPVIAADSLGSDLLIKHNENGLLMPVADAVNLAEAIKWVTTDPALVEHLRAAGERTFRETFAMGKVAPQYLSLLKRLTSKAA